MHQSFWPFPQAGVIIDFSHVIVCQSEYNRVLFLRATILLLPFQASEIMCLREKERQTSFG